MTKIVLLLTIIFTLGFFPLQAQKHTQITTTWDLNTGTNLSGFIISGTSDVSSEMHVGVSLGGSVNFEFTNQLALQTGLTFLHKTSNIDRINMPGKFQYCLDLYRQVSSNNLPWTMREEFGGANRMRKYYMGQYIGNNIVSTQAELRQHIG